MPRPTPGDYPIPLSPVTPGVSGYAPPTATNGQYAPSPFAVATPTAPATSTGRALPRVSELLSAFKRRWPLALMIGVVAALLMAGAIWLAMPSGKHRVQATLQFMSSQTNLLGGNTDLNQDQFNKKMEGHKKYMESKDFLDTVVADSKVSALPSIAGVPVEERANVIRGMLTFKRESDEIVTLTLNGEDEIEMKSILEAMVDSYKLKDVNDEKNGRKETLDKLNKAITDLDKQIETKRNKLREDQGNSKFDAVRLTLVINSISATDIRLGDAKGQLLNAKNTHETFDRQLKEGSLTFDPADVDKVLTNNTQVAEKRVQFDAAQKKATLMAKSLVAGDPSLLEAEAAVKTARAAVTDAESGAVAGAADSLKNTQRLRLQKQVAEQKTAVEVAQRNVEDLQVTLERLIQNRKELESGKVDEVNANRDIEPLVNSRSEHQKQKTELEIEKNISPRIIVIDKPEIYRNYNLKQKWAFSAIAAIAGLLVVCLLVSYVEWRNRRVDGVDQVVTELGMRVIGTIPAFPSRAALRAGETGANQNWRFILNESVNSTRTMLLHTARTQQMQVILITSAMQGEGKTSLSSQLATSMATAGLRTLILDCDMRNPSMQKLFDVPVAPGCAEILLQEIDISDAVQQTSVPNLSIIPAGQCNHRVIAALAQGHPIEALLNRLRGQYDIIIVDSCPILPVADTLLIAQHVDGVVFSILQDVSQLPKVQDAAERMVQLNIPLLGAVVNGIKPDIQAYGYNYVKQLPA